MLPTRKSRKSYPEISRKEFESAVQFIETDGTIYRGAEAVFRSLGYRFGCKWMMRAYERLPGFAWITEAAYQQVARHRGAASFFTRLLWGNDVRRPTYYWSRFWFFRSLGVIYLIAFVSLWVQVDGLIGENGILPVREYLSGVGSQFGVGWSELPTVCWWNSTNAFLHFLCGAGVVISVLLMVGILPVASLISLFVLYLSLTVAGQTFLSFQWDILLLETGFLAIFFAPLGLWPRTGPWRSDRGSLVPVSRTRTFSSQAPALQTDVDVRRGETNQWRRFLVGPNGAELSLRDTTAPDGAWLVGASNARMVPEIFDLLCSFC